MPGIENALLGLRRLDDLALKDSVIHRLTPVVKLLTALVFIVVTVSFPKYDPAALWPMAFYPVVLIILAGLPAGYLLKRLSLTAPFILFIALFNPLFDRATLLKIGPFMVSGGWVSFTVMVTKFALTVLAALILVATSGINEIGSALLKLKIPRPFVIQLFFLFRYLNVLFEETARTLRAYSLRSLNRQGVSAKAWGSLVGQLLLRTVDRAQRTYYAMLCRGFSGNLHMTKVFKTRFGDLAYLLGWSGFFVLARLYNIPQILGSFLTGVGK